VAKSLLKGIHGADGPQLSATASPKDARTSVANHSWNVNGGLNRMSRRHPSRRTGEAPRRRAGTERPVRRGFEKYRTATAYGVAAPTGTETPSSTWSSMVTFASAFNFSV
jgi:hypothetical protein